MSSILKSEAVVTRPGCSRAASSCCFWDIRHGDHCHAGALACERVLEALPGPEVKQPIAGKHARGEHTSRRSLR